MLWVASRDSRGPKCPTEVLNVSRMLQGYLKISKIPWISDIPRILGKIETPKGLGIPRKPKGTKDRKGSKDFEVHTVP